MSADGSLRASHADREQLVERLRCATIEGRLELEEFEARVESALRARTYGELARLVADLPGDLAPHSERRDPPRRVPPRATPTTPATSASAGFPLTVPSPVRAGVMAVHAAIALGGCGYLIWAVLPQLASAGPLLGAGALLATICVVLLVIALGVAPLAAARERPGEVPPGPARY